MYSHQFFLRFTFPLSHSSTRRKRCPLTIERSSELCSQPNQLFAQTHLCFRTRARQPWLWLTELSEAAIDQDGPVRLPPSSSSSSFSNPFDNPDPSPLQVATSVLLTGAISVFLFRSLRRRARRAKELRLRSSGAKSFKEDALDSLKAMRSSSVEVGAPPTPLQALLGAISAGVIAVLLYNFTLTIEASLNRQTISDNFSVRQITITIRTIINGLCYLATFVFGINSIGLFLYSGQLAINSFMGTSTSDTRSPGDDGQQSTINSSNKTPAGNVDPNGNGGQKNVDETQQ